MRSERPTAKARGDRGEALVADELVRRGCQILARNFRCRFGELDLIALDGGTLCFVEVKLRSETRYGLPREAVTPAKQRKLRTTAAYYLATHDCDLPARFDVAEVYDGAVGNPRVVYWEDAF